VKILFLSRWYPDPPNNGSKLRIYHLLRGLARHHDVSLVSFTEPSEAPRPVNGLRQVCRDIQTVPWRPFAPNSWRARLGFLQHRPRSIADTFSPQMAGAIREALTTRDFDLVLASELPAAAYVEHFHGKPALFDDIELGALHDQFHLADGPARRLRYGLTWHKHSRYVARLLRSFRACTVVSERERQLVDTALGGRRHTRIEVIPNCIELSEYQYAADGHIANRLIFTGSLSYSANYEAIVWFLNEVWPLIQARMPAAELMITGDRAGKTLPPASNLRLTGYVPDIQGLIASAAISLAPIWSGSGTRLKIIEAMAIGTPVVSTRKGAEGLAVRDDEHLLLANTPAAFAEAVVRLLNDPATGRRLADNARQYISENHDWSRIMPRYLGLLEQLR
jgi:polysaccharide biosynthesis protein PslH